MRIEKEQILRDLNHDFKLLCQRNRDGLMVTRRRQVFGE
ncbi:hypothetical protein DES41_1011001 [Pseudorhodoferax soli]|uniref:Uncharacterized protein n=1 Tax=Pseudorhodoferax soli TaxID=545864 RepID=A0A368Y8H0_9BURK|nr:hypothetical protein DES41_1011001 [Pseudorhodoferax soli]